MTSLRNGYRDRSGCRDGDDWDRNRDSRMRATRAGRGVTTSGGAAVESNRVYSESAVVNITVVRNSPANRGSTTTLVVGDIGTLRSTLVCKRTLASVRHAKVEVNIGVLVGVYAEVGNGEGINVTAAANRGG
jgi:hypothetical protein